MLGKLGSLALCHKEQQKERGQGVAVLQKVADGEEKK